jgi:hypothetical protein
MLIEIGNLRQSSEYLDEETQERSLMEISSK